MRPTFMGFEAAKSAIFTNQKSIDIMGNNLANIDTAGYTRQRVERTAVSPSSYSSRVASTRTALAGQGVDTQGVSQVRDSFLDKRFRDTYSVASYHSQASEILDGIQSAMGDGNDITDESGLFGAIKQVMESLNDYVGDPTMDTEANLVMSAFKNVTQVLRQMDTALVSLSARHADDLETGVDRVNEIVEQVANLNRMIGDDATVATDPENEYFRANELLDQRNLLLDELASYGDIDVTPQPNGKVDVSMGGHSLIKGNTCDGITMSKNGDGTVNMVWRSSGENLSINSGSLLANIHFINGRGTNVQTNVEEPNQGIPYYRDQLDTFARTLVDMVNNTVPELDTATGKPAVDAEGKTVYKTLLAGITESGATSTQQKVTAANISISDEWTQGGAGYFIYSRTESVEDYAQQLATQLTEKEYTFTSYGEKYTGTFVDFEVNFLGKVGSDLSFHTGRYQANASIADDFLSRRDEISGVSQDEETTDMLKYQKSYEAASRVMTVLDDMLDVIVNRMGRAGL